MSSDYGRDLYLQLRTLEPPRQHGKETIVAKKSKGKSAKASQEMPKAAKNEKTKKKEEAETKRKALEEEVADKKAIAKKNAKAAKQANDETVVTNKKASDARDKEDAPKKEPVSKKKTLREKLTLTESESRSVVIRGVYDILVHVNIFLIMNPGILFFQVLGKEQDSISGLPRGVLDKELGLNEKDGARAVAIIGAVRTGVELALVLKEREATIERLWASIQADGKLEDLLHSFFRAGEKQFGASKEALDVYLASKIREDLNSKLPVTRSGMRKSIRPRP